MPNYIRFITGKVLDNPILICECLNHFLTVRRRVTGNGYSLILQIASTLRRADS